MSDQIFSLAALTVLELSPPDMVEVAARAGYSHVGLRLEPATPEEHHFPLVADAQLRRQTLQRLRDTGTKVLDIEILRLKPDTQVQAFLTVLEAGAEFEASDLLIAGNDPDPVRTADNVAALCELALPFGIHVNLEFMPWTDVRNLTEAWHIVEQAGRSNGAVLIDAFHFDRSGSSVQALAVASATAPQRLRYAQLCDVVGPRPAEMAEILRQARQERRFPGDGDCDLHGLLKALPSGIPLSLEIPTRQLMEQGVCAYDRARLALDKAREVLASLR